MNFMSAKEKIVPSLSVGQDIAEASARRLRRLAVAGLILCGLGAVLPAAWLIWSCTDIARFHMVVHQQLPDMAFVITSTAWGLGAVICACLYGLYAWVLWQAAALFRLVRQGERFGPAMEIGLQRLALAALVGAIGGVLSKPLLGVIVTWANGPHHRQLVLAVSSEDVTALLAAVLFSLLARIVAEGRRIDEENRGFI